MCAFFAGAPQDAADEVQYFNGTADTPMGRLRANNGHPEPYRIKYWQVGNERGGPEYENKVAAFCQAMKRADPSIKLLSSYPRSGVLQKAGQFLDYTCPHHYDIADLAGAARPGRDSGAHRAIRAGAADQDRGNRVEYHRGRLGAEAPRLWTLENALACSRYHNLLHRHADIVEIANRSNLTNSFCSGIIQTDNHRLYKTPTYYVQQLYATLAGNRPLKVDSAPPAGTGLDVSATLSATGDSVILFVVNDSPSDLTRTLDLSAFGDRGQEASVWTLADQQHAGEPDVANNFAVPERVKPISSVFHAPSSRPAYRFPALALTVVQWHVSR